MEDEVMERIRARLAAATSAATALAKSLDALNENTLQTLEFWLANQEGDAKCAQCGAQMPRGKETSVCIACGCKRPPLPNTPAYDFKVSFAFLQFLETIYPPLKSGSRKIWDPIVSTTASESPEPSASIANIPVEREIAETRIEDILVESEIAESSIEDMPAVEPKVAVAIESVQHSKEDLMIDENTHPNNFQESPSDDDNGMIAGEDGREADDFGDFQESWGENANHEISDDVVKLNGTSHSDQFSTDLKAAKVEIEAEVVYANSGAGNTWDTEWDCPPSHVMSTKTQPEENVLSDNIFENSKDVTRAAPQVPEYDFSIFESFKGIESKEEKVLLPDTDADAAFWDFQNKNISNPRLASVKAMERFASDSSAFTTISDADSDSGDSSLEALPPPKLPLDMLMELGANSGQNNLLGSLTSDELDDFQKIAASSHPLATVPTSQDPFSWPLDTLGTMPSQVVEGDIQNVERSSAATLETNGQVALDPFPWPLEEFDSGTNTVAHTTIQQESLDLMDSGRPQSEENRVDPFSWPLDTFSQIMPAVDKSDAIGPVSTFQAQVIDDTAQEVAEDWGDEEFVWSQAEPANEAQFTSNVDLLPSPSSTSFSSNTIAGDTFMNKDRFFHDQSSPIPSGTNFSVPSPDDFANFGNGVESFVTTTEGEKTVTMEGDPFKSTHVKSSSFGDRLDKVSGLDNMDDLVKRSASFGGNSQVKDMAEGDALLKALQTPSILQQPAPSSSEPQAEDILNFLNLKPASSSSSQVNVSLTKPSTHVRSVSFDTVELVPEEQSDEMFQFFHTRSLSAGSSSAPKSSAVEDGDKDGTFDKIPSVPKTPPVENLVVDDDPYSFIHTAIAPSAQPETVEVKAATNDDGDDDNDDNDDGFFEWKSAEMPVTTAPSEAVLLQPSPASSQQPDLLFQWTTSLRASTPSNPSKPSGMGSLSGLLSLAGGLPPSQTRASSKEDDLFPALSRNSGVQTRQPAVEVVHSSKPGDDSEDEFSDFVSTGALPSVPLPTSTQQHTSQPAFDVSFFEAPQPNPSEKGNLDFFGDLMGLNFTNA